MAEGRRLKKPRQIEAEKEQGGEGGGGDGEDKIKIKKKRPDSVKGRDGERLVVGGGGQSEPAEVIEYSCPNCYKMLPSTLRTR